MSFWKKLYWCLFRRRIPFAKDEELNNVDAFVTQGLARLSTGQAGPGDEVLADAVERIHRRYPKTPIIAQDVVAEILQKRGIPCVSIDKAKNGFFTHSNFYWNTFVIAQRQYDWCQKSGIQNVAFVCAPDHTIRSYLAYSRVGFRDPKAVQTDPNQSHYHHPKSLYWSLRGSRWRFLLREFFCKLLFLFTGRL